jgi:hypothetical protein
MLHQLDLKGIPKSAKEMGRLSNFHDFLNEQLHTEKRKLSYLNVIILYIL